MRTPSTGSRLRPGTARLHSAGSTLPHLWPTGSSTGSPPRLRPGTAPHTLQIPPRGGHPVLQLSSGQNPNLVHPLGSSHRFQLRARLGFSLSAFPGQRGVTPAFGYGAPHPSTRGTSTFLIWTLPSTHYESVRLPASAQHRASVFPCATPPSVTIPMDPAGPPGSRKELFVRDVVHDPGGA